MKKFVTALALAGVLATGATAVLAQQNVIEARKDLMKANGQQSGVLTRMARGTDPFDAAKAKAAFDALANTYAKFPTVFPESSKDGDTRAMAAIWTDRPKFDAEIAKAAKNVADNRDKGSASLDGLKQAVAVIGQDCGTCHESFRKPR